MEWKKATKESSVKKAIRVLDNGDLAMVSEAGKINGLMTLSEIAVSPSLFDDWQPAGYCPDKPSIFSRSPKKQKELEGRIEVLEEDIKRLRGWL